MDMSTSISILSFTATASTFALFLCGLQICERIRRRGSTDGTSVAPFFLTAVSCIFWLGYGVVRDDFTILLVNGIGLVVQGLYFAYYYLKTRVKTRLNRLIMVGVLCSCWTYYWLISDIDAAFRENVLGVICMMLNIATIGAPLLDVGQVIHTKSTESLPFSLCVGNMLVSLQWLLYGALADDFYIKVPNSVAVVIAGIQLSLFVVYPSNTAGAHKLTDDHTHLI